MILLILIIACIAFAILGTVLSNLPRKKLFKNDKFEKMIVTPMETKTDKDFLPLSSRYVFTSNEITPEEIYSDEKTWDLEGEKECFEGSNIPANFIQTYFTNKLKPRMRDAVESIKYHNRESFPKLRYYFFNDDDCKKFLYTIAENDFPGVCRAFETVKPGAYKADIFRLAALYYLGGIYVDISMMIPLKDIVRTAEIPRFDELIKSIYVSKGSDCKLDLIVPRERALSGAAHSSVYQAFICSSRKNKVIGHILKNIILNVNDRINVNSNLSITGPVAFGKFFLDFYKNQGFEFKDIKEANDLPNVGILLLSNGMAVKSDSFIDYTNGIVTSLDKKIKILYTKYPDWMKDRPPGSHYGKMFLLGNIYNTKEDVERKLSTYSYEL